MLSVSPLRGRELRGKAVISQYLLLTIGFEWFLSKDIE